MLMKECWLRCNDCGTCRRAITNVLPLLRGSDNEPTRNSDCARLFVWPRQWCHHLVAPLHKTRSAVDPGNYRGIHLATQLPKIVERAFETMLTPFLEETISFGANPFAYQNGRGARDAVALLSLEWLTAFENQQKVSVYCSDVAGAFDKVRRKRLFAKWQGQGVH